MPETPGQPFPRAALLAAEDVPHATIRQLRRSLVEGGICLGLVEDLLDGTLPADTPLLALFRHPAAALLARLGGIASRPGSRVLGVAIAGAAPWPGQDPVEDRWRSAGLRPADLLLWDGIAPPALVLARLLSTVAPSTEPGPRASGSVDVVLRTGRVLRIRPDVAPDVLRRLIETLEG